MTNLSVHGYPNPGGDKGRFNPEGGIDHSFTAGEALTRGEVVEFTSGSTITVIKAAVDSDKPIGTVFDVSVASGSKAWITTDGIGYIKPESGVTAAVNDVCFVSDAEAGTCDMAATLPAQLRHNREIGHAAEAGTGAGAVVKGIIHQN